MKYIILFALLLYASATYGQDLIVTIAGDSLKCKIVEAGADKMQFRFGTGNIISIARNEVASYKFNFEPASGKPETTGRATNKNAPAKPADPIYNSPKADEQKEKTIQPEAASKTLQPVPVDEKGGEITVTITDLSRKWRVVENPEWCAVTRKGKALTVTCGENPDTTDRKNEIVIADDAYRVVIPIVQAAKSCYEAGMSESRELYRKAQAMQTVGNKDEAARLFFEAFKKIQNTINSCKVPANHESANKESGTLTDNIRKGIKAVGYTIKDNELVKPEDKKTAVPSEPLPRFYVAATAGASTFGAYSFGKIKSGGPAVFGADMAYFFKPWLGAGLKLNAGTCDVDFGESLTYHEMMTFVGPALYGRWEISAFAVTGSAGVGALIWKLSNLHGPGGSSDNASYTSAGGFLSAGVNYMITRHFGVGMNVQTTLGSIKDKYDWVRKPAGVGATLGINFRF